MDQGGFVSFADSSSVAKTWYWDFGDSTTWFWDFGDTTSPPYDYDSVRNFAHIYDSIGTYVVCLIVSNECGADTTCDSLFIPVVAVKELSVSSKQLSVYPNPFNTFSILKIKNFDASMKYSLFLYDILGNKVKIITDTNKDEIIINRGNLPAGMYFYKLLTKKEIVGRGKIAITP